MFFPILFFISSTSLEQQCSERQKYELAKAAEKCFTKFFSQIDLSNACTQTNCETNLSKCHSPDYVGSMRKYFHEKAIYYKYWLILSKKLLGDPRSESVFYFFSPFLLQYCSEVGRITSGQEYFNECMHVKVRSECLLTIRQNAPFENLMKPFICLCGEVEKRTICCDWWGLAGPEGLLPGDQVVPDPARVLRIYGLAPYRARISLKFS